jgi:hypothetical protein
MQTVALGNEWFYGVPVPLDDIERVIPLLSSGDREEYLRGWLILMLKGTRFADPARQLEGDELACYLARKAPLMPDSDISRSVHAILKISFDFAARPTQ